ncbi:MAG: hypothetical protein JWM86_1386 [Thermoleophilia bacterium]|nr:hypothetical protein [Thermoleophilia bacterium]
MRLAVVLFVAMTGWSVGSALLLRERGEPVDAVVRDFVVHPRRGETARPIWSYRYQGRAYEHRAPVGDQSLEVGDRAVLLVDPSHPGTALQRGELWRQSRLVAAITGALVVFTSLCFLLVRRIGRGRG